jgi:hypothetical protein
MGVRMVHVVAKTHLDLGFTALASEVEAQYLDDFFPRAIATAAELRQRGGPEQLVWTTGSWILHRALLADDDAGRTDVAEAIVGGDLAWHAYPFTTHTELMDADLVRAGLGISQELDARFGRPTNTAAKMTDVPGHTRGLVPLLAEAGVTFFHVGVNPAWPVPDVPPVFRWRSPDGSEVTVAYQSGGYGGRVVVDGCDHVLAFLHTGDNLGPPTPDDVIQAHAELADEFPGAEIKASTLDAFARALAESGAEHELPVVTQEIGDPWIFGCASDPQKLRAFRRHLMGSRPRENPAEKLEPWRRRRRSTLPVAEHTWGLDQKIALPVERAWGRGDLAALRAAPEGRRFESSWAEQRSYLDQRHYAPTARAATALAVLDDGWVALDPKDGPIEAACWSLGFDAATGALDYLAVRESGIAVADARHELGLLTYQTFDEADYERFYAGLTPAPEDEWWARRDNTKPGIDRSGAVSATWHPRLNGLWRESGSNRFRTCLAFEEGPTTSFGAPPELWMEWLFGEGDEGHGGDRSTGDDGFVLLGLAWAAKPATRLPEALWCSFDVRVADPDRWLLRKLGQEVSPLDVVRHGGRSLHASPSISYEGPDGGWWLTTPDAPLVAPGRPNLLDPDPPLPDLRGGWHVLLHDNLWGTNFPMWNEGPAEFSFGLMRP